MAIQVGSVQVDVIPNTRGIYGRLRDGLVPAATRAGDDAGNAAGRSFGPALQRQVGDIGLRIGEEIGQQIASRITASLRDAIRDGVTQGGRTARPAATRQGDETAGAFSRALKTRLEAAFRSLPKLQIGADTSEVDADLQAVRVRMETLADKRIGIDISADDAKAEIALIEAELTRLGARHPNVQVRADTARAIAELRAVRAEINAVDGKRAKIDVDAGGATAAVFQLGIALAGIAVIPAIPALAAGLGAVASAAVAAAIGVGVLVAVAVPAFVGIASVLMAQKQAQEAATTASIKGGQAASQNASKTLQMAGAQQALATAHRNAARQVSQAEQGVSDAVRRAAEASRTAAGQVRSARQALSDAYQQAAERMRSSNEQVERAEQSLADVQRAAQQAQQDLTQARRDAATQLEDLGNRLADAQLAERDAVLSVQEAKKRLQATTAAGSTASVLERQRAQLAYDQAVQRLKEQQLETKRTAEEKQKADKVGVEGSDVVRGAQERLEQAQRAVEEQAKAVAEAQRDAAAQQVQSARDIADAQERVAEAQRTVTRVQEDGARSVARAQESLVAAQQSAADSIESAQRQIASASLDTAAGMDQAAIAQQKYQQKLDKLSPSARDTLDAVVDLKDAFGDWSKALQPEAMPIFTRALEGVKSSLPGLKPLVLEAADGVKELQDRASAGFKKPWWREFKADLQSSIKPAIVGLGVSFGNVFKGMVGVVDAFLPHMDSISDRMEGVTGRFAAWGTGLKGSPEFERFLDYAAEMGPQVAETLGSIGGAFLALAEALHPLSGPVLEVIGTLAEGIASIARNAPWLIQGLYLLWIGTRLWTLSLVALNLVLDANPIVLIALAILGLVSAVIYAYKNFGWFREAVQTAWDGIKLAFQAAWRVINPILTGLWKGIKGLGDIVMWIWKHLIKPAIDLIVGGFQWMYDVLVGNSIIPDLVHAATSWFRTLGKAISVIFDAIKQAIKLAWDGIKAIWDGLRRYIYGPLAKAFTWLRDRVIEPVWGGISGTIGRVWRTGIRPVFDAIKLAVGKVADAFKDARTAIKTAWDAIKEDTKGPVNWVLKDVWNEGIVKVWRKITGWIPGVPSLGRVDYLASGGQLRGPQPGIYNQPTAIVGEGNPRYPEYVIPTDPQYRGRALALHQAAGTQLLAKGGVIGDVGDFLKNPMGKIRGLLDPLLNLGKHLKTTSWGKMALGLPKMAISGLKDMARKAIKKLFGGATESVLKALNWARGQAGKPYQWGGVGNPSWDCSGFLGAIQKVIEGKSPKGRIWSTHAFSGSRAPKGWVRDLPAPFQIGITNTGKGHTAGTLAGINVESRSGDGVVVGPKARGAHDPMFDAVYGFRPSLAAGGGMKGVEAAKFTAKQMLGEFGFSMKQWPPLENLWRGESGWRWDARNDASGAYGIPQALPASKMASAGSDWLTNPATQIKWGLGYIKGRYGSPEKAWSFWQNHRPHWYDAGGYLQPGLNLAYNGTGRPEPVFTAQQGNALARLATDPGAGDLHVQVYVGDREITDIARAEVRRSNGELVQTLRAGRR